MTTKITCPQDLLALKEKAKADIDLRTGQKDMRITVHMGTCGIAAGARDILTALMDELAGSNIETVTLQQSGCVGLCDKEPMMTLEDKEGKTFRYGKLDRNKIRQIVNEHVLRGHPVAEFLLKQ